MATEDALRDDNRVVTLLAVNASGEFKQVKMTDLTDRVLVDAAVSAFSSGLGTISQGSKTVTSAGAAERLVASTTDSEWVTIQAYNANTGLIAIGKSDVDATDATGTGVLLEAGDAFEFQITDLTNVYIDATVNGEGVRFTFTV